MAAGTAGHRGRIVRQRAVPAPLKRVPLETCSEVGTATSSCAAVPVTNWPPGGWPLPCIPSPIEEATATLLLPEASPSPIRVEDEFPDTVSSNFVAVTAPPSSMMPPLPEAEDMLPGRGRDVGMLQSEASTLAESERATAVVSLLPVYGHPPSEHNPAMLYALESGNPDIIPSSVDMDSGCLPRPPSFQPTPLPDPLLGFEIACECKSLQAALSDMTAKHHRAERSAELAEEQEAKLYRESSTLAESFREEHRIAVARTDIILKIEANRSAVVSDLENERGSLQEFQAQSRENSVRMDDFLNATREELNATRLELAVSQERNLTLEERSREVSQRSEKVQIETALELESVAKAEKSHREERSFYGEEILRLEEDVERLDFAGRRTRHTLAEENAEMREVGAEYNGKRVEVVKLRADRAELATALSEASAHAAACMEMEMWDRQRRVAAEDVKVEAEERQALLLDELLSARSVTLEEAQMVAVERCERDRDLEAYALQLQRAREEINRLQSEVHLLRLRIAAGSSATSDADPFSEVGRKRMGEVLQMPLLEPLPEFLQSLELCRSPGVVEPRALQSDDLPSFEDERGIDEVQATSSNPKKIAPSLTESPDPFAEIGIKDLCE